MRIKCCIVLFIVYIVEHGEENSQRKMKINAKVTRTNKVIFLQYQSFFS